LTPVATASNTVASTPLSGTAAAGGLAETHRAVGFDLLAGFNYQMPPEPLPTNATAIAALLGDQIPAAIRALDRQPVALKGFMMPLKVDKGLVMEMLIMRDQSMCCYGVIPKINDWVSVKMVAKGVKPILDQAVTVYGTFRVLEVVENGYLASIYAMDAQTVAGALDL
jgi:hypothetical protein